MSDNQQTQDQQPSGIFSWFKSKWQTNKTAVIAASSAAALIISLTAAALLFNGDKNDVQDGGNNGSTASEQIETAPENTIDNYDAENNTITLPGDNANDVVEPEPEKPVIEDTVIDSPEEVLELIDANGLNDVFAKEVSRIKSGSLNAASQATKDIGHYLANGLKVSEDDSLANQFFQASYDMNHNVQAAHSIGYQALHGLGMDKSLDLAEKMLSEAQDGGHPLAQAHLKYLNSIK